MNLRDGIHYSSDSASSTSVIVICIDYCYPHDSIFAEHA